MQLNELLSRVTKRWWILAIAIIFIIFSTWLYSKTNQSFTTSTVYKASIAVGINSSEDTKAPNYLSFVPVKQMSVYSNYLEKRFASPEIQYKVATKMGIELSDFNQTLPFYGIVSQDGGYVTLIYENSDKNIAQKFLTAVKEVYAQIISTEQGSDDLYKTDKTVTKKEFLEALFPVTKSFQQSSYMYLPGVAATLVAIFILLCIPLKIKK